MRIAFKHLDSAEESPKPTCERITNLIPSQLQSFLLLLQTVETVCTSLGVHELFRDRWHNLVLQHRRIIGWQKESRWRLSGLDSNAVAPVSSMIFAGDSPIFRRCFDSTSTLSRSSQIREDPWLSRESWSPKAPKRTWNSITNRYDPPLLIWFSSLFFQFASSWFCYGICAARCCCGCEVAVVMLRANSQLLIECEAEGGRLKSETEWRLNRVKFEPNEDWRYWVLEEEAWGLKKMRVKNVTCRKLKNLLRMRLLRSIYRLLSFNSVRDGELLVIWLWVSFFSVGIG